MAELERTKQLNELKTKRDYKGYDDDEFAEGQAGIRKSILAKYDEDIEGPQETVRERSEITAISTIHSIQRVSA